MRNWTPEARKRQSEIARRDRPWEKSTGPRTGAGKERSRWNALRHGYETASARAKRDALCRALRAQAAHVRAINIFIKLKKSGALRAETENELLCALTRQGDFVSYDLRRAIRGLRPSPLIPLPTGEGKEGISPTGRGRLSADKKHELFIQNNTLQKNGTPGPGGVHSIFSATIPKKMTNTLNKNLLRIDMTKRGAL